MKKIIVGIISIILILAIVFPASAISVIPLKSIQLDKKSITLKVGETYKLNIAFTPANTTRKSLTFVIANKKIANVNKDGVITAIGPGTTVVTISSSSNKKIMAKCSIIVAQPLAPVKLTWYVYRDSTFPDDQLVLDQANKIIKSKINASLKMISYSYSEYPQKLQLLLSSGDKFDLCFTASWLLTYGDYAAKNAFAPLDTLIAKYAPKTKALIPEKIWAGALAKDSSGKAQAFAVPCYQISYSQYGLMFKKDLVDKYKLADKIKAVKKQSDLTPILETIKKNEPDITPIMSGPWWAKEMYGNIYEALESNWAVVCGNDYKVMDYTNQTLFNWRLADAALEYKWYSSGYFHRDYGLSKDLNPELNAGNFFCWGDTYKPGVEADLKARLGYDVFAIPLGDPQLSSGSICNALTAISKNSQNKERAMMLLELMNSDKDLFNTMVYGIEGKHYTKTGPNSIKIVDNVKYKNNAWELGCQFLAYTLPGQPADVWEQTAKANIAAKATPLNGFVGDEKNIKTQITNMTNIVKSYDLGMSSDYESKLIEMRDRLIKAGMQDVTKEYQKQIDEWLKTK